MARLKKEELKKAREDWNKTVEEAKTAPLSPDLQKLMELLAVVYHDEEAKDILREEIIRRYGE